jgi:predicted RNA-binding protein with PUA-like domain
MGKKHSEPGGWLFKEEPTCYSFADLERDGQTVWGGITNNLALQYLRQVRAGDRVLYYHTGKEKRIVGEMQAVSDPQTATDDTKAVAVQVRLVRRWPQPVTLARIKQDDWLAQHWDLVRLPRLSVVPVSAEVWRRVEALSRETAG